MSMQRRYFLKSCAVACSLALIGGLSLAEAGNTAAPSADPMNSRIDKSIKAFFGGSFTVSSHAQKDNATSAEIESFGNKYKVVSKDLRDWTIVSADKDL